MEKFTKCCSNVLILVGLFAFLVACNSKNEPDLRLIPVKSSDKWEYIDKEGKIIINPQFDEANCFFEGLAAVRNTATPPRYGFIDDKGIYVINANYVQVTRFSEGLACVVQENGAPTYVDAKGQIKITLKDAQTATIFREGFACFSQNDKDGKVIYGYIDNTGAQKIVPQFSEAQLFSDGMAGVANKDGKWGFIDTKGQIVINYQFNYVQSYKEGLCIVYDGKNYGYIDKSGKYVINPQFEEASPFSEGLASVRMTGKYGYIDKTGKIQINPQFESASEFNNSCAAVESSRKWGYIDKDGKYLINPQFDGATKFFGKIAFVGSNRKAGIIDKEGKYLVNPQFDDISEDVFESDKRNTSVTTDYFDPSINASFLQGFTDLFNTNPLAGAVIDKLRNFKYRIDYSIINADSVLSNKSRVTLRFGGDNAIKTIDYSNGGMESINTSVTMRSFDADIYVPRAKAKMLFESLKTMASTKPGLVLNTQQSNDNSAFYESSTQFWRIFMRNDSNIEFGIQQKAPAPGMGD